MNAHIPIILVIDDEPIARQTLEALLASDSVQLFFAEEGQTGIEMAQKLRPDAIILDVMMPGLDGYQVCRKLRADPNLAETHIILLTALDDRDARLAGLMAGADDFISKPFDGLELQLRLRTITRLSRFHRLLAERSRFSWLVEHSEDGYLLVNSSGIIQYANSSAQALLHLPQDSVGVDFFSHVLRYYMPRPAETWVEWANEPVTCYLVQPESATARAFWLLLEGIDTPLAKETIRVVRIQDVTEKLTTLQDMRKFHLAITHKMRTPLVQLVISMKLLQAGVNALSDAGMKESMDAAMKGVNRLVDEVKDVLNYIDAPLAIEHGSPVQISALPGMVRTVQAQTGILDVQINLSPVLSDSSLAISPHAFGLIVSELFENSQKFHPEHNPQVEMTVEPEDDGKSVRISVADNGVTLTAEQLNWARRPYFQGEKIFTGETPGMGLGIPLIATLIWQVGGQMRIANRNDRSGVVVQLSIPIRHPPQAKQDFSSKPNVNRLAGSQHSD